MKTLSICILFVELTLGLCSFSNGGECANGRCSVRRPAVRLPFLGIRGRIANRRV